MAHVFADHGLSPSMGGVVVQVASCSFNFSGWLLWTYDSDNAAEQPELYSLMDNNGAINGLLSPTVRPNGCVA